MKKLSNKKGLFLAEILLAVVIAAVIMGSGSCYMQIFNQRTTKTPQPQTCKHLSLR